MYAEWGIGLFRNLRINIFIFYLLTVVTFLALLYYIVLFLGVKSFILLGAIFLALVILAAVFIAKLAVDPLEKYVNNLQDLSKETLHELNLPISTITTNTQMMKKNLADTKALKRIERIESACTMLQQRYNELDYLIKMQTQKVEKEEFFLDEVVKERVLFLQKIYPQIEFRLSLSECKLSLDKIGLLKVLDNLIDNGVKYSGNSKKIDIKVEESTLVIRDYGIGMDEVELLTIFDRYYQANSDMQGFGIGLTMVKRFCDENKIELLLDSSPNEGTTIILKFKQDN